MYKTTNKKVVKELVELLAAKNIHHAVISPGSRNAPLIIALANHPKIKTYVIVDERSAAFFALGLAQRLKTPVAITSTSGSAPLNYAPAVSEAYYQQIPLLILTADRPVEWINQGEGQAINQVNIYKNYVKKSFNLPAEASENDDLWFANRTINQAINLSFKKPLGPVHINIPLREPIYDTEIFDEYKPRIFSETINITHCNQDIQNILEKESLAEKRILILAGLLDKNKELNDLLEKISLKNIVILSETTSNLFSYRFFSVIDRDITISDAEIEHQLIPDILITLGHSVISKRVKSLLRKSKNMQHWSVGFSHTPQDTYKALSLDFQIDELEFLKQLNDLQFQGNYQYYTLWQKIHLSRTEKHLDFIAASKWSDLIAYNTIFSYLPDNCHIHLGNSTPARYAQLFEFKKDYVWLSNRGTSGIDGATSTAVGYASLNSDITLLLTGDLSFYYDINALWNKYLSPNLRVIVFNNQGGSIFRYIPGPDTTNELEDYFEAFQPNRNAEQVANMFQIPYFAANNKEELQSIMSDFFLPSDNPAILEVFTPRIDNANILRDYFKFLNK